MTLQERLFCTVKNPIASRGDRGEFCADTRLLHKSLRTTQSLARFIVPVQSGARINFRVAELWEQSDDTGDSRDLSDGRIDNLPVFRKQSPRQSCRNAGETLEDKFMLLLFSTSALLPPASRT